MGNNRYDGEGRLLGADGKPIDKPAECETEGGRIKSLMIDGKQVKVVNTVTLMEIIVHKLEDGREVTQCIAQDFMMTEHKEYMVRQLTDAINMVMRAATKRSGLIKAVSKAVAHKLGLRNRGK